MSLAFCEICNKGFNTKPSHQKRGWGKFCSIICRIKSQLKGITVNCDICNKQVYRSQKSLSRSKSQKYFCSKTCQTLWRNNLYIESNHANWTNGKSTYRNILKRNGKLPICNNCGLTDLRILNVHHIDHDRSNNKISNLAWLCFNCHHLVHLDDKIKLDPK